MDFNFFEPYATVTEKKDIFKIIIKLACILGIGGMTLLSGIKGVQVILLQRSITSMETEIKSMEASGQLEEYSRLTQELENKEIEEKVFVAFDGFLNSIHTGSGKVLGMMGSALTQNMYLKSINIDRNTVGIEGVALNKEVVGDYESVLRNSGYFEEIFINSANVHDISQGDLPSVHEFRSEFDVDVIKMNEIKEELEDDLENNELDNSNEENNELDNSDEENIEFKEGN